MIMNPETPSYTTTAFGATVAGFIASIATMLTNPNPTVQVVSAIGLVAVPLAFVVCNAWLKHQA
jgi:hypothetical protein